MIIVVQCGSGTEYENFRHTGFNRYCSTGLRLCAVQSKSFKASSRTTHFNHLVKRVRGFTVLAQIQFLTGSLLTQP
jgi:hypothetical protein